MFFISLGCTIFRGERGGGAVPGRLNQAKSTNPRPGVFFDTP